MIDGRKVLAIVPARGGSKGVPRKNIRPLGDKPLIAWTLEAAHESSYIDRTIVSTDDIEISKVARRYSGEVPFLRPNELASDESSSVSVVQHALSVLDEAFSIVVFLQPTSPFRSSIQIDEALELMNLHKTNSVVSVVEESKSPEWMFWLDEKSLGMSPILEEGSSTRRQDCRKAYSLNGAIYCISTELFRKYPGFVFKDTVPYLMTKKTSLDIDSLEDFDLAEYKLSSKNYKDH